jgi:methylated-DNA-[protein]-cysteine S-methyltransferase
VGVVIDVATMATPCGPFTVMAAGEVVVASGWTTEVNQLLGTWPDGWRPRHDLGPITRAVRLYLDGAVDAIDAVAVRQRSGPFIEQAWEALRAVAPGSPVSYSALAAACGRPRAARAAGTACGRNAVALFVPCHRAVRGDGSLGGFRWGRAVKRWLLDHEARYGALSDGTPSDGALSDGTLSDGTLSDGQLAGGGIVGVEPAVDHERHR